MPKLFETSEINEFIDDIAGVSAGKTPERMQAIVRKVVGDLFETIDAFDVSDDEFWHALSFIASAGPEFGLIAPGLGFEKFLDMRADRKEELAGRSGGTPRTIEGPLYVANAPLVENGARIDDGSDKDGQVLIMQGQVKGPNGEAVSGAVVDVWHANTMGGYSYFDKTQSDYNLRRRIKADEAGRYSFRSIVPKGYSVPPGSCTETLLDKIGRHGHRPAHIHFFVTAPDFRQLTTQINIADDPHLHDDFAYGTRDELIPNIEQITDAKGIADQGLNESFAKITFDFHLARADTQSEQALSSRPRVQSV